MLTDSPGNRRAIRLFITILQSYGPFCLAYTIWVVAAKALHPLAIRHDRFLNNALLWCIFPPEALFYIFLLVYGHVYIQRSAAHPPNRTRDERRALFQKVRSEIFDLAGFLSGWFKGAQIEDIGRDEMRRFLNWAFWEGRAGEIDKTEDEAEIDYFVEMVEEMMPAPFKVGWGTAKSLRLTLDPIEIEYRSLLWYSLIMFADTFGLVLLMCKGYKYYRRNMLGLASVFPPRPAALCAQHVSLAPSFSYFLKPHTSRSRLPLVWIHGIGIGLLPYVGFLEELHSALNADAAEDGQVGMLIIEILQISSRLTTPIPRRSEFLSQLTTVIGHHFGSGRFVLAAHSYGSVLSSHVMNDAHLSPRISATLLMDPVSILLHTPTVAYNFTVKPPVRANEWQLWYFASKDPQIAHTLGRHFFWSENCLWRDQIEHLMLNHNMRFTASLASEDLIVDTKAVRAYLTKSDLSGPVRIQGEDDRTGLQPQTHDTGEVIESKESHGSGLEVMWWEGYDHAEVFGSQEDRAKLITVLCQYVEGT